MRFIAALFQSVQSGEISILIMELFYSHHFYHDQTQKIASEVFLSMFPIISDVKSSHDTSLLLVCMSANLNSFHKVGSTYQSNKTREKQISGDLRQKKRKNEAVKKTCNIKFKSCRKLSCSEHQFLPVRFKLVLLP